MGTLKIGFSALFILFVFSGLSYADNDFLIRIDLKSMKLFLIENKKEKTSYPVAVPRVIPKNTPIIGEVVRIKKNPYWYPTEPTRRYYQKKNGIELPRVLKPGDARNAMGVAKIIIIFKTPGVNCTIRIHGTNDESSISQRITRGCIRMRNNDILSLAEIINGKTVLVEII